MYLGMNQFTIVQCQDDIINFELTIYFHYTISCFFTFSIAMHIVINWESK